MRSKTELIRREGFFSYSRNGKLPKPVARKNPWKGKREFLQALRAIQIRSSVTYYRGFSICRICGEVNGNSEFELGGWCWPGGFAHYIEEHNCRPSLAFQEFVLGRKVGGSDG